MAPVQVQLRVGYASNVGLKGDSGVANPNQVVVTVHSSDGPVSNDAGEEVGEAQFTTKAVQADSGRAVFNEASLLTFPSLDAWVLFRVWNVLNTEGTSAKWLLLGQTAAGPVRSWPARESVTFEAGIGVDNPDSMGVEFTVQIGEDDDDCGPDPGPQPS